MNQNFKLGDIVTFKPNSPRGPKQEFVLVRRFQYEIFHGKLADGSIVRVRTSELVRLRRPSDEIKADEVARRKVAKARELDLRKKTAQRNAEEFGPVAKQLGMRITADGLLDKRCKPNYTARTSPYVIKRRGKTVFD